MDFKLRRGTTAEWASANPVLPDGLPGFNRTLGKLKIGNGVDTWSVLPYVTGDQDLSATVSDTAPTNPSNGQGWFHTTSGISYLWVDDGDSSAWVETGSVGVSAASVVSVTPAGNIAATNVQAALEELDTEKQPAGTYATGTGTADGTNTGDQDLSGKANLTANTFTGAQIGAVTALTSSAASIAIDLAVNNNFSHTTSEDTTLAAPTNAVGGYHASTTITQGATPRLLAFNSFYKFPGGTIPSLTASVGAVDLLVMAVSPDATFAACQLIKDVK